MTDQTILTSEIIKSRDQYGRLLINQYLLLSELGKGQHGRVREAIDTETNERFAIKMVDRSPKKRLLGSKSRPSTAESSNLPQFRKPTDEKICKEIAILKKLHHENVVRLKEIIDDGASKTIYMILELMEGGEIQWKQQVYNDNGDTITIPTMSVNQARSTLTDVILGLEYLHYQGIIHRDIKPANLLWTGDHRVKISDFGVSHFSYALSAQSPDQSPLFTMSSTNKSETQLESSTPTSPNSPVSNASEEPLFTDQDLAKTAGSPAFFAPELCYQRSSQREGKRPRITNAIDVWALGVTLYCLLFGKVPFTAENEYALFNIIPIQAVEYPAYAGSDQLSLQDTEEGAQLRDLLDKLFEKDPTKRITLAQVKSHPWILRGIHEPSEWLKHTDVNASPAVQVTNEEVASALNFKSKIKRGWRTIADAFNAATGATGIPRRDSVNSSYNYNPYQQYPSQSELDVHSDDNNPYAPTSAIKQVYNRDREAVAAQPSQSPPQQQQRRMSVLERDSTVPTLAAPHPSHQPQSRLSRAASTSSQSSRPHGHIASDPSSRRQSIHHLHSNAPSTAQSPRSSLSNELGTSTHQHPFTSPTPIPMLRGNSDTCTLSNSGSTGEYDDQLLGGVSRSSAASPAASQSTSKRNSIRGFLKGLTLSNRKSSMSSNASNASTRFASFSEHREREKEERREREQKERQGREEREREIRKISHSSLSPTSSSHQRQPAMLAPPPRAPEYTDTYDDDVDIDVQLSGHSDSSDEDDDDEGARDRILSLSHSHSSNLRSSIIAIDDDSDDGAESSDISELHQPTQYWSNRGDGWKHVGAGEEVYDLTEESSHKISQGNHGLGVGLAKSVSVGDSGDSASTSTGNDNSTPVPTPHKHSESDSSTPNKPGSIGVGVGNESTTDTASLATFKMRRDEASTQGEEREERVQDKDASQHYLQVGDARALHAPHLGHHHHHHIDECAADSSSSDSEGDTLEITPRRSRNSSFAITSRSPSMSLSPTKLGQSGVLSAPPPQAPALGDK